MSRTEVDVSGADPGGWIGWLAPPPTPSPSPRRKFPPKKNNNTRKNKRKYDGPKNINTCNGHACKCMAIARSSKILAC